MPGAYPFTNRQRSFFIDVDEPESSEAERRAASWVEHSIARHAARGADSYDFGSGLLRNGGDLVEVVSGAYDEALLALGNRCNCAPQDAAVWAEQWMAGLLRAVVERGLEPEAAEAGAGGGGAPAASASGREQAPAAAAEAAAGGDEAAAAAAPPRVLISRKVFQEFARAKLKDPALAGVRAPTRRDGCCAFSALSSFLRRRR